MRRFALGLLALIVSVAFGAPLPAQPPEGSVVIQSDVRLATTDNYPLDTCLVCDKALPEAAPGASMTVVEIEGRKFKLCCAACKPVLEKDVKAFTKKLDAAVVASQAPGYPAPGTRDPRFSRCLICRSDLAKADAPVAHVTKSNVMVIVCSEACAAGFDAHKSARQRHEVAMRGLVSMRTAGYTAKTCPVCSKEPGDKPAWIAHGNTLLKLCGDACVERFKATPNTFVATFRAAEAGPGEGKAGTEGKAKEAAGAEKPVKK